MIRPDFPSPRLLTDAEIEAMHITKLCRNESAATVKLLSEHSRTDGDRRWNRALQPPPGCARTVGKKLGQSGQEADLERQSFVMRTPNDWRPATWHELAWLWAWPAVLAAMVAVCVWAVP